MQGVISAPNQQKNPNNYIMDIQNPNTESQDVATTDGISLHNIEALMNASTKLDKLKTVVNLSSKYIELEATGDSFRGVYAGMTVCNVTDNDTGEIKEMPAARFIIDKQIRINAGYVLVDEIKRSGLPIGSPVEVTYVEKKNRLKIYSITLLG
jgi:hypothetical protein